MTTWTLTVCTLSDWHVGLGAGRAGLVDRLVRRDTTDLPYVPAKSILGVMRDNARSVVRALDASPGVQADDAQTSAASWQDWLDALFGARPDQVPLGVTPTAGLLMVEPARLGDDVAIGLGAYPELKHSLTAIRPGVQIDRRTGAAQEKHFRQVEVARSGLSLQGTLTLDDARWTDDQRTTAAALLWAVLRVTDRLGGKRRRGLGEVTLTAHGLDSSLGGRLRSAPAPLPSAVVPVSVPVPASSSLVVSGDTGSSHDNSDRQWRSWDVELWLRSPVCVPVEVVGNVVMSARHLMGTVLFPAVAGFLRGQVDSLVVDGLVRRGELLVGDATPMVEGVRSEPVPLSLAGERRPVVGGARTVAYTVAGDGVSDSVPRKQLRRGYMATADDVLLLDPVGLGELTHNVIDEDSQRPTSEVGGVYTYQAIPASRVFGARISARCDDDVALAMAALAGTNLRLGQAKKGDYGAVSVEAVREVSLAPGDDDGIVAAAGDKLVVRLVSAAVLLDDWLRPSANARDLARAIEAAAAEAGHELELSVVETDDTPGAPVGATVRSFRHDGWLADAGLPRPSLHGLTGGSTVWLTIVSGTLTIGLRRHLQSVGVGERRAEGFGQLLVGDPLANRRAMSMEHHIPLAPPSRTREGSGDELMASLSRSALRRALRERAALETAKANVRASVFGGGGSPGKPTASQLGSLREMVSTVRTPEDRETVRAWLAHLKVTENRRRKWPPRFVETLGGLVADDNMEGVWELLKLSQSERRSRFALTGNLDAEVTRELWPEAFRTLVISCIRQHIRLSGGGEA